MEKLNIDFESVESVITDLVSSLNSNQSSINEAYGQIAASFSKSSGKEAQALKRLQKTEKSLTQEATRVLTQFSNSIRFASNEFKTKDINTSNAIKTGRV